MVFNCIRAGAYSSTAAPCAGVSSKQEEQRQQSSYNKAPNSAGSVDQVKQRAQRRLRRALDFKVRQLARDRSRKAKAAQRQSDSAAFPARKQAQSTAIFVEPGAAPAASGEQRHMRGVAHQTHVPPKNWPQKPPALELNRGVLGSWGGKNTPRESTVGLFS